MKLKNVNKVISIDIGATSGRIMEVSLTNLGEISYKEVKRFHNKVMRIGDSLYWDINYLMKEIFDTLENVDKNIKSIAISTWGCDICLLDENDNLIDNPRCYRDEHNVIVQKEFSRKYFSYQNVYEITGIQNLPFNTIYQLLYLRDYNSEIYQKIKTILMIPDYIAYVLTGKKRIEETNASTTALYDVTEKAFSKSILDKLNIKSEIFPPIINPGDSYGLLKDELKKKFNFGNVEVIACATHDTGSAVMGSLQNSETAYLSSGTWSLLGVLIDSPIKTKVAMQENYTNEIGYDSKVRFLKNIMGMWILEEYRRELAEEKIDNSFETILKEFNEKTKKISLIDPDDEIFLTVGNMSKRIDQFIKETNQKKLLSRKEYIQTIYYSLAYKYRFVFEKMSKIVGKKYSKLNIVGGGAKNDLLSQLVADILQIEVISGPVEATVLGNSAVQFLHHKLVKTEDVHNLILNSDKNIKVFKPNKELKEYYDEKYNEFLKLLEVKNG